jgi:hypothetical protein
VRSRLARACEGEPSARNRPPGLAAGFPYGLARLVDRIAAHMGMIEVKGQV